MQLSTLRCPNFIHFLCFDQSMGRVLTSVSPARVLKFIIPFFFTSRRELFDLKVLTGKMRNVNKQFGKEGHLYNLIEGKYSTLKFKTGRETFFEKTKQKELHLWAED